MAAPFLDLLTRQVEREVLGPAGMPHEPSLAATMFRVLGHEARKLLLYLGVMGLLFLLNLLPGLGTLAYTILAGTATCFFLALELLDFPLERRGLSLRAKLAYVRGLGLTGLAFGLAALALGMVPVLNFTLLPLAAVGGTLLYLERPAQP